MAILDRPPPEWKRPSITLAAQVAALLGLLRRLGVPSVHYDHRPPLSERKFDTEKWDTIPPANDQRHLEAITPKEHDVRTNGPGGEKRITTLGSDAHNRAKSKRLTAAQEDFRRRVLAVERVEAPRKRIWGSRPFQKRRGS